MPNVTYMSHHRSLILGGRMVKKNQKCVLCGPFGLFYMPHNFPLRGIGSGFLWVKDSIFGIVKKKKKQSTPSVLWKYP